MWRVIAAGSIVAGFDGPSRPRHGFLARRIASSTVDSGNIKLRGASAESNDAYQFAVSHRSASRGRLPLPLPTSSVDPQPKQGVCRVPLLAPRDSRDEPVRHVMSGHSFTYDFRRASMIQAGGTKAVEAENRAVICFRNGDKRFRRSAVMTLASVLLEKLVERGIAAIEGIAIVFLRDRLFPPTGDAHDSSGKERAALRSLALAGGGFPAMLTPVGYRSLPFRRSCSIKPRQARCAKRNWSCRSGPEQRHAGSSLCRLA